MASRKHLIYMSYLLNWDNLVFAIFLGNRQKKGDLTMKDQNHKSIEKGHDKDNSQNMRKSDLQNQTSKYLKERVYGIEKRSKDDSHVPLIELERLHSDHRQ